MQHTPVFKKTLSKSKELLSSDAEDNSSEAGISEGNSGSELDFEGSETNDVARIQSASSEKLSTIPAGEENEMTLFSIKAKLFAMDVESKEWKERGSGTIKLNKSADDPNSVRLIMRTNVVQKLILNCRLFKKMNVEIVQSQNVRLSTIEEGEIRHYLLRLRTPLDALELCAAVHTEIFKDDDDQ